MKNIEFILSSKFYLVFWIELIKENIVLMVMVYVHVYVCVYMCVSEFIYRYMYLQLIYIDNEAMEI